MINSMLPEDWDNMTGQEAFVWWIDFCTQMGLNSYENARPGNVAGKRRPPNFKGYYTCRFCNAGYSSTTLHMWARKHQPTGEKACNAFEHINLPQHLNSWTLAGLANDNT